MKKVDKEEEVVEINLPPTKEEKLLKYRKETGERIIAAFRSSDRTDDLRTLCQMKIHINEFGKLGDLYERMLNDIERRLELKK